MRKRLQLVLRHDGQLALIIAAMALIFSVVSPAFRTTGNLVSLMENYSVMAIMAAGLLVVLISGGIDISFAAIAAVTQYVVALILINAGGNWLVAFALAAAFGGLLGVVNALLIYCLRALSVIVTISTMTCYLLIADVCDRGHSTSFTIYRIWFYGRA